MMFRAKTSCSMAGSRSRWRRRVGEADMGAAWHALVMMMVVVVVVLVVVVVVISLAMALTA